jgi:hypothetical protein
MLSLGYSERRGRFSERSQRDERDKENSEIGIWSRKLFMKENAVGGFGFYY